MASTARSTLSPYKVDQIHVQANLARSASADASRKKEIKLRKPQQAAGTGSDLRAPHHGLYGGHVNGFITPCAKPPPDPDAVPPETAGKRYRLIYRQRKNDDLLETVLQEADINARETADDDDDRNDVSNSSQSPYDVQTLSTIPEVPSNLAGTLTPSALNEIYPSSKERGRRTFGSSLAKLFSERRRRLSASASSYNLDTTTTGSGDSPSPGATTNSTGASTIGVVKMRYSTTNRRMEQTERRRQASSTVVDQRGHHGPPRGDHVEQSSSSYSSSSSSTPSSDPVAVAWSDRKHLAPPPPPPLAPSSITSFTGSRRKLFVLVAVIVSVILVVVAVAVVVSVELSSSTSSKVNQSSPTPLQNVTSTAIQYSQLSSSTSSKVNQSSPTPLQNVTSTTIRYSQLSSSTSSKVNQSSPTPLQNVTSTAIQYSLLWSTTTPYYNQRTSTLLKAITNLSITPNLVTRSAMNSTTAVPPSASSSNASRPMPTNMTSSPVHVTGSLSVLPSTISRGQTTLGVQGTSQRSLVDTGSSSTQASSSVTAGTEAAPTDGEPSTTDVTGDVIG